MDQRPIGVIDSGVGGISILNEVVKHLPNENYIYYADSIHNPYGNKTREELILIINEIMEVLCQSNVKMVIVACNTASTQVISYLRETYSDLLFVAVEPAIKVAYDVYRDKNVLVMATPGTIQSDRLMELDHAYYQKGRVLLPCNGLAELIEQEKIEKIPLYLSQLFQNVDTSKVEVVVLGCTHYPFIKKEIEESIGHRVTFVDGSLGVARRVEALLNENHIRNLSEKQGKLSFILTDERRRKTVEKYLKI